MKSIIKNEMRRTFINKVFWSIILVEIIFIGVYTIIEVLPIYNKTLPFLQSNIDTGKVKYIPGALYTWLGFMTSSLRSMLFTVIPILAALPCGISLYMDEKTRYVNHIFLREDKSKFYIAKLLNMFLSGGVVASFPFALSMIVNMCLMPVEDVIPSMSIFSAVDTSIFGALFYEHPLIFVCIYLLVLFVGFGLINCICFAATYLFSNVFVVLIVPFGIYFMSFVISNIFGRLSTPWLYLRFNEMRNNDLPWALLQAFIVIALVGVIFKYKSSKGKDAL